MTAKNLSTWDNLAPPPLQCSSSNLDLYAINSTGIGLSLLCGVSLGIGHTLLLSAFDELDQPKNKPTDKNADRKLVKACTIAGIGGALFNLGLYLVVPTWVRNFWLSEL